MNIEHKMQYFLMKRINEKLENDLDDMMYVVSGKYDLLEDTLTEWCDNVKLFATEAIVDHLEKSLFSQMLQMDYPKECHPYIMGKVWEEIALKVTKHEMDKEFDPFCEAMKEICEEVINDG